ncbi:putative secreted protein with PEP-CTERM sorting signal [Pseudoduganella flava]|uniref:PEP-CTERM sorting domain-containing protein n=1 Tax=Pseudoduganella flava TaxID=871742 RepID=A0A562PWD5_9BURK|nr:PEP-CTERM sorting domain-containing protein [Pseudoduganella flava]QGZ39815.1 PEP-CTERM sorting domain-containing protein [Pseudoduganella flava]TWI48735.1 putative secreted protein with PEP-CTERM sorting signal [Pseudoduganella flava]
MLKKMAVIAALAACGIARAEVQELKVVYRGFYDVYAKQFKPKFLEIAYFNVDDRNHDGTYSLDEVVKFEWGSVHYEGQCYSDPTVWNCLSSFSYTPGSNPSFSAGFGVADDMFPWGHSIVAGDHVEWYSRSGSGYLKWTDETTTEIMPASAYVPALPEPSQYAMFGLGLAGVLAASLRRKRAA